MSDTETPTKRTRSVPTYDIDRCLVEVKTGDAKAAYSLEDIPERIRIRVALEGLFIRMSRADDPELEFQRLMAGNLPERKAQAGKKPDHWRAAYAAALVEGSKKSDSPYTQEAAEQRASMLDRSGLAAVKKHPLVVKHYARLSGGTPDLDALTGAPTEVAEAAD